MNNLFNPTTALGSAFNSVFTAHPTATADQQSNGKATAYRPTSISAHSTGGTKICKDCHHQFPVKAVTEVHPVPGLTMYQCADCLAMTHAAAGTDTGMPIEAVHDAHA
jgi:hypothetical protein